MFESNLSKIVKLNEIANKLNVSMPSLCLNWIKHTIENSIPLFGATKSSELFENISSPYYKIDKEILKKINSIFDE